MRRARLVGNDVALAAVAQAAKPQSQTWYPVSIEIFGTAKECRFG